MSKIYNCRHVNTSLTDPKRYSFTFQMCALLSRYQIIENAISSSSSGSGHDQPSHKIFVTERCLDTDYECFTKMLHAENNINQLEFTIYQQYFSHLKSTSTPLSGIIHLTTDPGTCQDRIRQRQRDGESAISIDYLTKVLDIICCKYISNFSSDYVPVCGVVGSVHWRLDRLLSAAGAYRRRRRGRRRRYRWLPQVTADTGDN